MKKLIQDATGYAAASSCALLVDITILWVLVHYFSWWYLAASTVSFLSGVLVTYALSVKLVFKHHRLKDRRAEFIAFAALGTLGLAINATVIFVAVKYMALNYLIAKCVATGFTFMCNFISRRQLLFVLNTPA
jgi:putative flippase GtrA